MQILIFGMHRSGTSMTTRLVNMMGAYFGPENSIGTVKDENPKGFWERAEVYKLNDALLAAHGCSWSDLKNWSFSEPLSVSDAVTENIRRFIHGMDAFRPWVVKDPRMCLTFSAWRPVLEVPVAVLVHRNPIEVAVSLQTRNNFPLEYGIALWEHYVVGLLNNTMDVPRAFVRYVDLHQRPMEACEALHTQLVTLGVRRLEMPYENEIRAFIDPTLYRSRAQNVAGIELTPAQKILAEMVRGIRAQDGPVAVSEESKAIIKNNPM